LSNNILKSTDQQYLKRKSERLVFNTKYREPFRGPSQKQQLNKRIIMC